MKPSCAPCADANPYAVLANDEDDEDDEDDGGTRAPSARFPPATRPHRHAPWRVGLLIAALICNEVMIGLSRQRRDGQQQEPREQTDEREQPPQHQQQRQRWREDPPLTWRRPVATAPFLVPPLGCDDSASASALMTPARSFTQFHQRRFVISSGLRPPVRKGMQSQHVPLGSAFFGRCYQCACLGHSQKWCPVNKCRRCGQWGHSDVVCDAVCKAVS